MPLRVRTGRRLQAAPPPADALDLTATPWLHERDWPLPGVTPGARAAERERTLQALRRHYREHRAWWDELLARESVTILCNIHVGPERCLRFLLAEVLVKLGAVYEGEVG